MENKFEHIEDVIAKVLAGEASREEIALLDEWKNLNAENAKEFSQYEKLFSMSSSPDIINVDTDAAWLRVKESLTTPVPKGKVIQIKGSKQFTPLLRIAAVLLLVAGLTISIFFMIDRNAEGFANVVTGDSIKVFSLPDGSVTTLNRNSSLTYSINSFTKKRTVKLKGEAYFNVKHDSLSLFVVEAGDLQISDIGTAFNVNAKGSDVVIVSVNEGKVELTTVSNKSVFLAAGEEAEYNVHTKVISKPEEIDENIDAYRDKIFIFDNADLGTVIKTLNSIYDVKLELENDSLENCKITVSFNNERVEDIAEIIAVTLNLSLKKEAGKIIFRGDGCR